MPRLNTVKKFRGTSKTKDGCLTCESCGEKIEPGDSYMWWANKTTYSSTKHVRCSDHPPKGWEMSANHYVRSFAMVEEGATDAVDDAKCGPEDDLDTFKDEIESIVRALGESDIAEIAGEYEESYTNMEEGFGHPTYQSEEIEEKYNQVTEQAEELESFEISADPPNTEDTEGDDDEEWTDQVQEWVEAVKDEANEAIAAGCEVP